MVVFAKTERDVTIFKPKMRQAKTLEIVPFDFTHKRNQTVQVKADGEFNVLHYSREGDTFLTNRFGRETRDLPALNEFISRLHDWNVVEAELGVELYAIDEQGKPLTLPHLIHFLKGHDQKLEQIKIGVFDLYSLNGKTSDLIPALKFTQLSSWFEGLKLVHVLEWIEPTNLEEVKHFWTQKVEQEKWEGLICRINGDTYKVKPNCDMDAVIIGLNKNTKGWENQRATSVKLALINEEGQFVEVGDCSGIGEEESRELYKLVEFKVGEDRVTLFVEPIVVATIEYIQTYPNTRNRVFSFATGFREVGEAKLVRLRNPHVKGYRADKKPCFEDVGLNQVEIQ